MPLSARPTRTTAPVPRSRGGLAMAFALGWAPVGVAGAQGGTLPPRPGVTAPAVAPINVASSAAPVPMAVPTTPGGASAPTGAPALVPLVPAAVLRARPFGPGERSTYEIRFGGVKLGVGEMEVRDLELVRGQPAYHTVFRIRGGTRFFRVDDVFESWFATADLASLRFHQDQEEGRKERRRRYEIYPERRSFVERTGKRRELPSVANPLDDGSFLYYIRTVPLEVGRSYSFHQYFKPERNPVTIRVLRRERVKVPAGTFDALVVQPVINTSGIFAEGGRAEVWLSDDERRIVLQVKSKVTFGSLNMYMTSHRAPTALPVAGR